MSTIRLLTGTQVQDDGVAVLTSPEIINFTGAGVNVSTPSDGNVVINIPAGGGLLEQYKQQTIAPAYAAPYNVSSYIGYTLANGQPSSGVVTFTVDRIYCCPHFFKKNSIVYGFKYRKASAFNQQCRVGIYDHSSLTGNWWPGSLLGSVVKTTVADVTPVVTTSESGFPWTCPADGVYGVAIIFDTATQGIGALDTGKTFDNFLGYQMHSSTVNGWNTMLTYNQVYGALPNPFPTSSVTLVKSSDAAPNAPPMLYIIHQALS